MSIVGKVSFIVGKVIALDKAGSERTLSLGDEVLDTERVVASLDSKVELSMLSGVSTVIENGNSWIPAANFNTFTDNLLVDELVATATDSNSVASIQQALLSSQDVTQTAEATAAGAGADSGLDNDGSVNLVRIERVAGAVGPAVSAFDTIGSTVNLSSLIDSAQEFPRLTVTSIAAFTEDIATLDVGSVAEGDDLLFSVTLSDEAVGSVVFSFTLEIMAN